MHREPRFPGRNGGFKRGRVFANSAAVDAARLARLWRGPNSGVIPKFDRDKDGLACE